MKNKHFWVGYLTMGDKKRTLVARDERVETGKSSTVFLYNQERDQIVEYNREIIEAKLSDAAEVDYDAKKMIDAYKKALRNKLPNLYRIIFTPNSGVRAAAKEKKVEVTEDDDEIELDDNFIDIDDDLDDDDEDDLGDNNLGNDEEER
jgi:hypothetical protein